jgi:hypothetical protein
VLHTVPVPGIGLSDDPVPGSALRTGTGPVPVPVPGTRGIPNMYIYTFYINLFRCS